MYCKLICEEQFKFVLCRARKKYLNQLDNFFFHSTTMASRLLPLFKTREVGLACVILTCMTLSEVDRLALKFKVANLSRDLADQKDAYEAILKDQKAQLVGPTTKR